MALHLGSFALFYFIVFIVVLGTLILYGYFYVKKRRTEINASWTDYRCKPYVMPFVGWGIGPAGTTAGGNFRDCVDILAKDVVYAALHPISTIISLIKDILKAIVDDLQNMRKMFAYIRDSVEDMAQDIYLKIWNTYGRIAFLYKKIMNIFATLFDMFRAMFDTMEYAVYSVISLWQNIRGVACFFCFDGGSLVHLKDGSYRAIRDVRLGEVLSDGGVVYSVMEVSTRGMEMYEYRGVQVSGSHSVLVEGHMVRVSDVPEAQRIAYTGDRIYCLETSTGKIHIAGTGADVVFADYYETRSKPLNGVIQQMIRNVVNGGGLNVKCALNYPNEIGWGFHKDTTITMCDGTRRPIHKVRIGDITTFGPVRAVIRSCSPEVEWYSWRGLVATGSQLVYIGTGEWQPMSEIGRYLGTNDTIYYNICTTTNRIMVNGNVSAVDFEQVSDQRVNHAIDQLVDQFTNGRIQIAH